MGVGELERGPWAKLKELERRWTSSAVLVGSQKHERRVASIKLSDHVRRRNGRIVDC